MIGGLMKTTSRLTIATAFAAFATTGVMAADLGGNCCSDLEERVAELEATTARKGNRVVSLEVSGHVNEAILFWDDGHDNEAYIVTNSYSQSRFRFKGSAKISSDLSAGFLMEFGNNGTGSSAGSKQSAKSTGAGGPSTRHEALYIKSNRMGTVWLGWTTVAVDGIADICIGCTLGSSVDGSLGWGGFAARTASGGTGPSWTALGAGRNPGSSPRSRRQVLKYISPDLAGFQVSADWGGADNATGDDEQWSVALRYANEFNGVRVAGGVGYHEDSSPVGATGLTQDITGWGASVAMQHVASGFFIAGSYANVEDDLITAAGERGELENWSIVAGVGRKFSPMGKTSFWVRYGEFEGHTRTFDDSTGTAVFGGTATERVHGNTEVIAFGIDQAIDAAAMNVYLSYYNVSGDAINAATGAKTSLDDFNAVIVGAIIRF